MKQNKFLTVFAVFDDATQQKLKAFQESVFRLGYAGTQTMGIPFHISLGSFQVEKEQELTERIKETCSQNNEFEIRLNKVNHFNHRVLFIEPEEHAKLRCLHNAFNGNFADGFPWYAHATVFCGGEEQVSKAKDCLNEIFEPFTAKITGIQMGEFFPPRMILEENLCK